MTIPIIGEPTVEDWFLAAQVKCPCGQQFQLVGQPGSMRACKGSDGKGADCNRIYKLDMIPIQQTNGEYGFAPIVLDADGMFSSAGLGVGIVPRG
jgi:hypothetical protein